MQSKFEIINNEIGFEKFEVNLNTIGTIKSIEGKKMVVAKSLTNFHSKENQGK
jgi:hypothetical protein